MTKFEELQAQHERLMEQSRSPENVADFVSEVQHEIQHMCVAAEDISAPRERDQLRAILRFWASYVYDHTGTYPDTTLHPALNKNASSSPPPFSKDVDQVGIEIGHDKFSNGKVDIGKLQVPIKPMLIIVSALAVCLIAFTVLLARPTNVTTPAVPVTPGASANVVPTIEQPLASPLQIQYTILTVGPSPFDADAWVVKVQLSATGGNGSYVFWVDNQVLPDISNNQYTVKGNGCDPQKPVVGVTSDGKATSLELVIQSPLECPRP